jgi:septum site-determining protein MinC
MEASPVLDFKSTTLYAIRVVLHTADMAAILATLDQRMLDAAGFFEDEPVVIDASRLSEDIDWPRLVDALKTHRLPTIGVMAQENLLESARNAGLVQVALPTTPVKPAREQSADAASNDASSSAASAKAGTAPAAAAKAASTSSASASAASAAATPATDAKAASTASPAPAPQAQAAASAPQPAQPAAEIVIDQNAAMGRPAAASATTMIVDRPLRSGQKIYARHADLIVLGIVSHGAEVIADGNIHVYGPLRGKAMAGARGNTDARIFTTQFEAELVAVAGVYRSMTATLAPEIQNKPATIRLDGEKLLVESLPI